MKIPFFGFSNSIVPVYPGGKTRMMHHIARCIPPHVNTIYSPFCGSCAVEINLAQKGIRIHASDNLDHLILLYRAAQMNKRQFIAAVNKLNKDITREKWDQFHYQVRYHLYDHDIFDSAAMVFLLFAYSLNGMTYSTKTTKTYKGRGFAAGAVAENPNDKITRCIRGRLRKIYRDIPPNMSFCCKSYEDIVKMKRKKNELLYCDPPYDSDQWMYGLAPETKTELMFNHETLADLMHKTDNWILSYNGTARIKSLYKEYKMIEYASHVMMGNNAKRNPMPELIIMSHDVAEIFYQHDILAFNEGE